jgi:inorganic pyrophosphatase
MNIDNIPIGDNPPRDVNVMVEIPLGGEPVKYELDKKSGALFVDRFLHTAMRYPANYGFIPHTLSGDGDPVDVLVITPFPVSGGSVVRCRPLGVLKMDDEAGGDAKLLAVPTDKILPIYKHWKKVEDINPDRLASIQHFFEHYKDLEKGKWVKVQGWEGPESAKREIIEGLARYKREAGS